jgi:hypothetical protein
MQLRRRQELEKLNTQEEPRLPDTHWERLTVLDPMTICSITGAKYDENDCFRLSILEEDICVSVKQRIVQIYHNEKWEEARYLQSLIALVYLVYAENAPLTGEWITEKDLKCSSFFRGIHTLQKGAILDRFGYDLKGFIEAGKKLGATKIDGADVALRIMALPKVPIKILLWAGDDDFPPEATFLFDESIEAYLPADGIWALVKFISERISNYSSINLE